MLISAPAASRVCRWPRCGSTTPAPWRPAARAAISIGALEEPINAARDAYRRQFLDATPGMTDYLHEELFHTLANDDTALLGPQYPGPLV